MRDVAVFDGVQLLGRRWVLVDNGRIAHVEKRISTPKGAVVIDGRGHTLLPGLIDAHVHLPPDAAALRQAALFGVTTQLDMFASPGTLLTLRAAQKVSQDLSDFRSAGVLATAPGGHGTQFRITIPTLTSADAADAFVAERVAEGSDYIKIVIEDGYGPSKRPTLSPQIVQALVAAAHRRHLLAIAHVTEPWAATLALEAGVDGLAHAYREESPPGLAAGLAASKVFVVPTLAVAHAAGGQSLGPALVDDADLGPRLSPLARVQATTSFGVQRSATSIEETMDTTRQLHRAGVDLLAGSDAPNPGTTFGASLHQELELLVRAGLTPIQALTAATATPARRFRLDDRGSIRSGARADLLLVRGDPTRQITVTRAIADVWVAGHRIASASR